MSASYEQAKKRVLNEPYFKRLGDPWTNVEFAALKERTNCTPPTDPAQFLRDPGSFVMSMENYFLAVFENGEVLKAELQIPLSPLKAMIDAYRSLRESTEFPDRFPFDMIFFGTADGGHSQLLMHSAEKEDPAVYLWPIAGAAWGTENNTMGLAKVADSLFDFFYYMTDFDSL